MLDSEPAKVAVTEFAAFNVKLQVVVPVHPPDQLANVLPVVGVSLSVTAVPGGNATAQPVGEPVVQLIPAGLLVTVPEPPPAGVTVKTSPLVALKVAVTLPAAMIFIVQVEVPEQPSPVHPPKVALLPAVAVSVKEVLGAKLAVQPDFEATEQLIPAGVLVTVPLPAPFNATVSPSPGMNEALTVVAADSVIEQLVPEQAPVQPAKK